VELTPGPRVGLVSGSVTAATLGELILEIDARALEQEAKLTGLFVRLEDIYRVP
jgi:hypothetical protein